MRSGTKGLAAAALLCGAYPASAQEDGGMPGKHAGQGATGFNLEQVKAAVNDFIQVKLNEGGGVYRLTDDKTGEELELEFVDIAIVSVEGMWRIHDPARKVEGGGYIACTDFHPVGAPKEKLYDIDVRLSPRDGKLEVVEVRIHKEPHLVNGKWAKVPRYTNTK